MTTIAGNNKSHWFCSYVEKKRRAEGKETSQRDMKRRHILHQDRLYRKQWVLDDIDHDCQLFSSRHESESQTHPLHPVDVMQDSRKDHEEKGTSSTKPGDLREKF